MAGQRSILGQLALLGEAGGALAELVDLAVVAAGELVAGAAAPGVPAGLAAVVGLGLGEHAGHVGSPWVRVLSWWAVGQMPLPNSQDSQNTRPQAGSPQQPVRGSPQSAVAEVAVARGGRGDVDHREEPGGGGDPGNDHAVGGGEVDGHVRSLGELVVCCPAFIIVKVLLVYPPYPKKFG